MVGIYFTVGLIGLVFMGLPSKQLGLVLVYGGNSWGLMSNFFFMRMVLLMRISGLP
jgi:hypothetical protein